MDMRSSVFLLYLALLCGVRAFWFHCDSSELIYQPAQRDCCQLWNLLEEVRVCCFDAGFQCKCRAVIPEDSYLTRKNIEQCLSPPTTTTTTPTTTTTTPTTTTTTPTTTTTTPTTTTTTPITSTTTLPTTTSTKLCPTPPESRLLSSVPVTDSCEQNGMISFRRKDEEIYACNAVYVYNDDVLRTQILMSTLCFQALEQELAANKTILVVTKEAYIEFKSEYLEVNKNETDVVADPRDVVTANLSSKFARILESLWYGCANGMCLYNPSKMQDYLDINSCYLASYGAIGIVNNEAYAYQGLSRLSVTIAAASNCNLSQSDVTAFCVKASGNGGTCLGDSSSGFFCSLTTGEDVLIGVTPTIGACDLDNPAPYITVRVVFSF